MNQLERLREYLAKVLHERGDAAYCHASALSKNELCLGEEAKIKSGDFTFENLKALENVRAKFGAAFALWEAAISVRADDLPPYASPGEDKEVADAFVKVCSTKGIDLLDPVERQAAELREAEQQIDRNHMAYEEAQGWVKKWAADCGRLEAELREVRKALLEISGAESIAEALDIFRRERVANIDLGTTNANMSELLKEWLDTELDSQDEEFMPWIKSFTARIHEALGGGK